MIIIEEETLEFRWLRI